MALAEIACDTRCLVVGSGVTGQAHLKAVNALLSGRCAGFGKSEKNRSAVRELGTPFFSVSLEQAVCEFQPTHAIDPRASPPLAMPAISSASTNRWHVH